MKTCTKCKIQYELDNFTKSSYSKDGLNYWCKNCARKKEKSYWRGEGRENRLVISIFKKQYLSIIKSKGCSICDEKSYCCLDFHHLKDKDFTIGKKYYLNKKLLEEISKCILLCSNCHRKCHNNEIDISHIKAIVPMTLEDFYNSIF